MSNRVSVLIVDDSAVVRQTLQEILESDEDIEVMGVASDPFVAAEKMRDRVPDVITLDIEMPRMDGLTFLKKIMQQHPIPVVICSSLAESESASALKALELGAVDIITKPKIGTKEFFEESRIHILDSVKSAAKARLDKKPSRMSVEPKLTADVILAKSQSQAMIQTTEKVLVVGASTGGTEALREFLTAMPLDTPGIVIVQHMPENFTRSFAERLNSLCKIHVKEAQHGDSVLRSHALIAPGNRHLLLKRSGARYYVEVNDGPLVNRHRPSVDVLFRSAARYAATNAIGIIMTGMGDDGARGMLEMHEAGSHTIAQDETSCIVFGMPREAIQHGGVDVVLPLHKIADHALHQARIDHHK